jgi:prepilin-type N-terminal cleavage/methylation domain-containing protein
LPGENSFKKLLKEALAMQRRRISGFTLIELLVVISIISLLMAILLPSLGKAREQARRATCMANLRSIGQGIFLYAHDNDDRLVPGDWRVSWDVWGQVAEYPRGCRIPPFLESKEVNLGHLIGSSILPLPGSNDHVFFCPSSRTPEGNRCYEDFVRGWGSADTIATISYMYNNSLDGFDGFVQDGQFAVLSHKNKINFLRGDGSVGTFNIKPLDFGSPQGPELLQEVSLRYGVCFPTAMLHRWLTSGEVNTNEAMEFLSSPQSWADSHSTLMNDPACRAVSEPVLLASVSTESLACDVVGVWGAAPPSG